MQSIDAADLAAVQRVLKSDRLTQGPAIATFENALSDFCGAPYAVAVSNGTTALHVAYVAAGIQKGDEVITTPNTFVATSNMLLTIGAIPVFCDIRSDTWNIDESKIEALITSRTRAISVVHFAGNPCAMDAILRIARKHKLLVIEDACQALGATYKELRVGGLTSDMTVFSFHPVKSITTAEGGAIVTRSAALHRRLSLLRAHGVEKDESGFNVMTELGFNYRLTDMQAALGTSQMKRLKSFLRVRRSLARVYDKELAGVKEIVTPVETDDAESAWHLYVIRVRDASLRMKLAEFLQKKGVGINFHYPAVYAHPYYREHGYKKTALTEEDAYAASCITLPLHQNLTTEDVRYVAAMIRDFFTGKHSK